MTELRINGFKRVLDIVRDLLPFLRFKKEQARALYKAADLLNRKKTNALQRTELLKLLGCVLVIQKNNYVSKRKKTKKDFMKILDLTP